MSKRTHQDLDLEECTQFFFEIFDFKSVPTPAQVKQKALEIANSTNEELEKWKEKANTFLDLGKCVYFINPLLQTLQERLVRQTSFSVLPDDIIENIYHRLPPKEAVNFSKSSKHLYNLLQPQNEEKKQVVERVKALLRLEEVPDDADLEYFIRPEHADIVIWAIKKYGRQFDFNYLRLFSILSLRSDDAITFTKFFHAVESDFENEQDLWDTKVDYFRMAIQDKKINIIHYFLQNIFPDHFQWRWYLDDQDFLKLQEMNIHLPFRE